MTIDGQASRARHGRGEQLPSHRERLGDDGVAVDVEDVEEERRQAGPATRRVGAEVAHRVLEAPRRAVVEHAEHLAVEHEIAARQRADELDHATEPVGHVVEVAGEQPDVAAAPMRLDARAVELPLDRRFAGGVDRGCDVRGR